jgi:RNA polymerase sigma-70 factor (ECF subfamily)
MDRYANGDDDAFAEVYDEVAPRVGAYLRRHAGREAKDLLQQTFLQIVDARPRFRRGAAVLPWAFTIARYLLISAKRHDQYEAGGLQRAIAGMRVPVAETPEQILEATQTAKRLAYGLTKLTRAQREALELVVFDRLSLDEAAQVLDTTPGAVKVKVCRARDALRESCDVGV